MPRELPYPEVDIDLVRKYAQTRADASSVRSLAGRIGLGHTTLDKFLEGSDPYPKNRTLLVEWYLREHGTHPARERLEVPTGLARRVEARLEEPRPEDHLDTLLGDLRGEARAEARRRIADALARAYRRMGRPAPRWLHGM